jgi:hypothetical protein
MRSSESVGALATALAKAQAELVNPEKGLVATIRDGNGTERSFRYAALSIGLDIIRKTLSRHEIATVQSTSLDDTTRQVRLTTTLAHSSGEWISSEWPVCAASEVNTPRRMGAALTYARRYSLFTLVGIAGEDDLDAPDLNDAQTSAASPPRTPMHSLNGKNPPKTALPLTAQLSAVLRDELIREIESLADQDAAAAWATRRMRAKNTLGGPDAKLVEAALEAKLAAGLDAAAAPETAHCDIQAEAAPAQPVSAQKLGGGEGVDKSKLPIGAPRRRRDKEHLRFVGKQPCLVCGRRPSDAHHVQFAQKRALGRKVSDEFAVPLCRTHHRELHRTGSEQAWWQRIGIEPIGIAQTLWDQRNAKPTGEIPATAATRISSSQKRSHRGAAGRAADAAALPPNLSGAQAPPEPKIVR